MNGLILCGAVQFAMFNAHIDNATRDRRRIKREVNKAARRAKLLLRVTPISPERGT